MAEQQRHMVHLRDIHSQDASHLAQLAVSYHVDGLVANKPLSQPGKITFTIHYSFSSWTLACHSNTSIFAVDVDHILPAAHSEGRTVGDERSGQGPFVHILGAD